MVASVPEFTILTRSIDGTRATSASAISTSSLKGAPNDAPGVIWF